jgi:hypothetical protein
MIWPFTRSTGWRNVKGKEGFNVEMPCKHTRKTQSVEREAGSLQLTIYRASPEAALTCQLTVRQGSSISTRSDTQLLADWKEEFMGVMTASNIAVELLSETALRLGDRSWELLYRGSQGRTALRIRLIRRGDAFFILSAICTPGTSDNWEAQSQRFLDSFTLTR